MEDALSRQTAAQDQLLSQKAPTSLKTKSRLSAAASDMFSPSSTRMVKDPF